jgi:hypothetical protein
VLNLSSTPSLRLEPESDDVACVCWLLACSWAAYHCRKVCAASCLEYRFLSSSCSRGESRFIDGCFQGIVFRIQRWNPISTMEMRGRLLIRVWRHLYTSVRKEPKICATFRHGPQGMWIFSVNDVGRRELYFTCLTRSFTATNGVRLSSPSLESENGGLCVCRQARNCDFCPWINFQVQGYVILDLSLRLFQLLQSPWLEDYLSLDVICLLVSFPLKYNLWI